MAKKSEIKRGAVFSYINLLISILISFIMSPMMKKAWGADVMGLYYLVGAMISYMSILDFGLGDCLVRYIAKYRAQGDKKGRDNFVSMSFTLYMIISAVVAIIGILIFINYHSFFPKKTAEEFALMDKIYVLILANLVISFSFQVFPGILSAYERFIFLRKMELARGIIRPAAVVILLYFKFSPVAVVMLDVVLNILYCGVTTVYAVVSERIRISLRGIDFSVLRELSSYSFFVFLAYVVNQINWKADQVILGVVKSGGIENAVSSQGTQFSNYFISISLTLAGLFLPRVTKMVVDKCSGAEMTNIMIKVGRIQFLILGLLFTGFSLLGYQFMMLWMKEEFINAYYIALMLMVALFVPEIQTVGLNILFAKNMHRFRSCILMVISIINILISIPLAERYGAVGAAFGTAFALMLGNGLILNIYYQKKIGIQIKRFFKETCHGVLPAMLLSILAGSLTFLIPQKGWLSFIIRGVIVTCIYCALQWLLGMNSYEKGLLLTPLKKLGNRRKKTEEQAG